MQIGLCFPYWSPEPATREFTLEWLRLVDEGPFSSVSCGERVNGPSLEMTAVLAAAAAVTRRVRIVPTLYVMTMHAAVWVAKHAATLDVLSNGRVTVTVGVGGGADWRAMEVAPTKVHAQLERQVAIMRRVWAGEAPFEGTLPIGPRPVQPGGPPIIAGVMRPRATLRVAHWADGVYAWSGNGERDEIARQVGQARAAWREAGHDRPPRLVAGFWCSLARDAEPRLREHVRGYVGLHDETLARAMAQKLTRFTPEAIDRALDDLQELGIDECMLLPVTRDLAEVDRLAQLVAKRG